MENEMIEFAQEVAAMVAISSFLITVAMWGSLI
jgi:hypothetical protein